MTLVAIASLVGAILVLIAFAGTQFKRLDPESRTHAVLNLVGGLILFTVATIERNPGFMLMEFVWSAVSLRSLIRRKG